MRESNNYTQCTKEENKPNNGHDDDDVNDGKNVLRMYDWRNLTRSTDSRTYPI